MKRIIRLILFYVLLISLCLPVLAGEIFASDVWKALYSGRYVVLFQQFPHHSTFTFSPVQNLVVRDTYAWLGNIVLYSVFMWGHGLGLQGMRFLLVIGSVLLLHSSINFRDRPIFLLLFTILIYGISQKLIIRTALFAIPFTTVLLWIWTRFRSRGNLKLWYLSLPLIILWSNLHGSYLVGLGLLFTIFCGESFDTIRSKSQLTSQNLIKIWSIFLLLLTGTIIIHPYPDQSSKYFILNLIGKPDVTKDRSQQNGTSNRQDHSSGAPDQGTNSGNRTTHNNSVGQASKKGQNLGLRTWNNIRSLLFTPLITRSQEFMNPFQRTDLLMVNINIFVLLVTFLLLFLHSLYREFLWALWIPFLSIGIVGLGFLRTIPYISLFSVSLLLLLLRNKKTILTTNFSNNAEIQLIPWCLVFLLVGSVSFYMSTRSTDSLMGHPYHSTGLGFSSEFPPQYSSELLRQYPQKKFFNEYGLGGYLIWYWWPFKKVLWDSKQSAYKHDFVEHLIKQPPFRTMKKRNLEIGIFTKHNPWINRYFKLSNRWKLLKQDGNLYSFMGMDVSSEK